MENFLGREELLIGTAAVERLKRARVALFGLGGVGGYAAEALARCGVGKFDLIDNDVVSPSNLNRQILATTQTIGRKKTEVCAERIKNINPDAEIFLHDVFFLPESRPMFDFSQYDYVIDAIDTVSGKIAIVLAAQEQNVPVVSCMGTGNKLDPTLLRIADIYKTSVCPLARVMRTELKKRGVKSLKVVYSEEVPKKPAADPTLKKQPPASIAFVPAVAGMYLASVVVRDLCDL